MITCVCCGLKREKTTVRRCKGVTFEKNEQATGGISEVEKPCKGFVCKDVGFCLCPTCKRETCGKCSIGCEICGKHCCGAPGKYKKDSNKNEYFATSCLRRCPCDFTKCCNKCWSEKNFGGLVLSCCLYSLEFCKGCFKPSGKKVCERCRNVSYCSQECQKKDWVRHRQKECKRFKVCQRCFKECKKTKCGQCKTATYCSQECLSKDWKNHKKECIKLLRKHLKKKKYKKKTLNNSE